MLRRRVPLLAAAAGLVLAVAAVPVSGAAGPDGPRAVDDPAVASGLAWHLEAIRAPTAWRSSLGADTTVAIVDSGVDVGHPDLAGQVVESVSCLGAGGDPGRCTATGDGAGDDGHGTHVAGLVAARADDGIGVAGVAPRAHLLAVRALRADCDQPGCLPVGDTADVAAGVRWAVAHGADVINLSLTATPLGPELSAAIDEAWEAGSVAVLAAGNRGGAGRFLGTGDAVVVTATDRSGGRAPYAADLTGTGLGVAAPGGGPDDPATTCRVGAVPAGIVSTYARDRGDRSGYACLAGTSMAVPQVSGGLALLLSMGFDRDGAVERLLQTAQPGPGLGAGRIDLAAAVAGPLPRGVTARAQSFATGAPDATAASTGTGPFAGVPGSAQARDPLDAVPSWLLLVTGLLAAALAVELSWRIVSRRRAEAALHARHR